MKRTTRLAINLLIVGGVLLFGGVMAPRSGGGDTSPGISGSIYTLPYNRIMLQFIYRGQTFAITFWSQCSSHEDIAVTPVDFYAMNLEEFHGFVENHSTQALLHMRSSFDTVNFSPEANGQYIFILEMLEPSGEKRCIGYNDQLRGVIFDFLQPAQVLLILSATLLAYDLLPRLSKRISSRDRSVKA